MRDTQFNARTRQMLDTLKRRAGGQAVPTLAELRYSLRRTMETRPLCPYCNKTLTLADVSLDHIVPVARGGNVGLHNTHFICKADNKAKGEMTHGEYKDLLAALDVIGAKHRNPGYRDGIIGTLKVGNSFRFGANRRAKKG